MEPPVPGNSSPVVLVISGPAGSGKTTLCQRMLGAFPNLRRVVTTTSRPPRPGEHEGVDYHFLSPEAFQQAIQQNAFVEWARVHGRFYGSQTRHFRQLLQSGFDLLLNIDVQGASSFRQNEHRIPEMAGRLHTIFIKPRSLDQIRKRLLHRATDDPDEIERRLQSARHEIPLASQFDHVIVSGQREEDFHALRNLYLRLKS